jgi:hypothetical protein
MEMWDLRVPGAVILKVPPAVIYNGPCVEDRLLSHPTIFWGSAEEVACVTGDSNTECSY